MVRRNISLKGFNTFGLDYKADNFVSIKSKDDISRYLDDRNLQKQPHLILGGGSNILFLEDFKGTIIHPATDGISLEERDSESVIISAGAGVKWDNLVEWTIDKGFGGLENLSLIPGNVGATPVQNIGAYGKEVKDSIYKVSAFSLHDGSTRIFTNDECRFGYRDSIFKKEEKDNYLIINVYYKLNINQLYTLNYGSLEEATKKLGGINLKNIRQAVINIRESKLPDPKVTGNAGSFFKNPVTDSKTAHSLRDRYPEIPVYRESEGKAKLAAGWMIEKCGWKGKRDGDAGVHERQALVLVNYGNATGRQIYNLSEKIRESVFEEFGVNIEREVEVVGSI